MIKGKWKLLICTILVTCVFFMASNSTFAAINMDYYNQNVAGQIVTDTGLDTKLSNNALVDALGGLIYGIASLLEWVLGGFFKMLTGTNIFPWADAILFNAIPFLDINVFNPSGASLLAQVQSFVSGTYYTVLMLASAFFGIAVMVTAIKLVLTAIAEDKARYKKAIVDWLLGLVMLWGIHFFISFALYLNEELVKVASSMATEALSESGDVIASLDDTTQHNEAIVYNFVIAQLADKPTAWEIIRGVLIAVLIIVVAITIGKYIAAFAAVKAGIVAAAGLAKFGAILTAVGQGLLSLGVVAAAGGGAGYLTYEATRDNLLPALYGINMDLEEERKTWIQNNSDKDTVTSFANDLYGVGQEFVDADGKPYKYNIVDVAAGLLKSKDYCEVRFPESMKSSGFDPNWWEKAADKKFIAVLYYDVNLLLGLENKNGRAMIDLKEEGQVLAIDYYRTNVEAFETLEVRDRITTGDNINYDANQHKLYKALVNVFDHYVGRQSSETNIITNLASYFKETAWSTSETGWKANKSVIQNALMYAILVVQSLIFFIAYVKRLFYVLMLILMAPFVVVMDFFTKFGK